MDSKPAISVIMSIYNEPIEWISQAIDSILNQTFKDFEFIIINDNPYNKLYTELLHCYVANDSRIILVENEDNKGLTQSLNIGLERAHGRYVARMDADDISMPNRFQTQYDFMESHPEIDVCGSSAVLFGKVSRFSNKHLLMPKTNDEIKIRSLVYSPMIHPSVMIRLERLPKKLYNEKFKKAQDYVLWGDLINKGFVFYNIPEFLINYRITVKSAKSGYRSQQYIAADTVRTQLLQQLFPTIDNVTIELHNKICNELECDLHEAEKWLKVLKERLIEEHTENIEPIKNLISRLWININLTNDNSLKIYRRSELTEHISMIDKLRFVKRSLCKHNIFKALMGGGKFIAYFVCYLLYYGFAQYLPSNYSRFGSIYKWIRHQLVRHIFRYCGTNVDINRRANFGNGRNVSIGHNSGLGAHCLIPNNITIGENVMMAPNCTILPNVNHSFSRTDIPMREQGVTYTIPTVIGNDIWIGQNVLITPGRVIQDGCVIAAGTVLTKDFPENSIIGGNPSSLIRCRLNRL